MIPGEPPGIQRVQIPRTGSCLPLSFKASPLTARATAAATGPTGTLRTLVAWQVPILHLMHELRQLFRPSLLAKLLKRVIFIFNIGLEGK